MKKAPQIVLFAVLAITVWLAPSGAIPAETTKIDKQIGGLTLKEAVDYAVVHNPSILKAQSEIAASHGDVIKARSHFLPKLEANGGVEQSIHQDIVTVKAGTFGNPTDIPFPLTSKTIPYASLKLEQLIYDFLWNCSWLVFPYATALLNTSRYLISFHYHHLIVFSHGMC